MKPLLIITADDYGMSPLFNRGIEELAGLDLITSVSVMIKRPWVDPKKLSFPKLAISLHLELEERSSLQEIEQQIKSFVALFGKLPAYLDGHQHKHLLPQNLPLVLGVAQKLCLPVRSRNKEDRVQLQAKGIPTPENFISWHPARIPVLTERLKQAVLFSCSEMVVHPGYFDPACDYPYNEEREAELAFLKSSFFKELVTPFEIVPYSVIL